MASLEVLPSLGVVVVVLTHLEVYHLNLRRHYRCFLISLHLSSVAFGLFLLLFVLGSLLSLPWFLLRFYFTTISVQSNHYRYLVHALSA